MTQAQISRRTRDLCQTCWQDANPGEYCPDLNRYGPCAECGDWALVVRSIIAEERSPVNIDADRITPNR